MSVKEQVFNVCKKRSEELNRFRNGCITQHLTSVDLSGFVRRGAIVLQFFEGFICDNLHFKFFEEFKIDMTAKKTNSKKRKMTYYKH